MLVFSLILMTLGAHAQVGNAKLQIDVVLDTWHKAAAKADFDMYFDLMTKDGVFLGTDATENWQNKAFREFFNNLCASMTCCRACSP